MTTNENDIDLLMDRDPLSLSSADLDAIIAHQRKYRAQLEASGGKAKKPAAKISLGKIDLSKLGIGAKPAPAPAAPPVKRRF